VKDPKSEADPFSDRLARLETDMQWVKDSLKRVENRTWYVIASVIAFGIVSIILSLV
jgi:hypothetical protein